MVNNISKIQPLIHYSRFYLPPLLPELLEDAELIEHRGDILSYGPDPIYQKPVIGQLPAWQNGYVATRFGGMGMVLSVGTGLIMADLIANKQIPYYARHLIDFLSPD
jgi:glycine/D-amino acid oxidase-like deaminating enzyme